MASIDQTICEKLSVEPIRIKPMMTEMLYKRFNQLSNKNVYYNLGDFIDFFNQHTSSLTAPEKEAIIRLLLHQGLSLQFWNPQCNVTIPVKHHLEHQVQRIKHDIIHQDTGYFSAFNDNTLKDAAILRGKLLPVGLGVVETGIQLVRRPLITGPILQRLTFLHLFLRKPLGLTTFFQHHLHKAMMDGFHEAGWKALYRTIAELLDANPDYKGHNGSAWFYDPNMRHISPHLSYIAQISKSGGAYHFNLGEDRSGYALSKSKKRQKLFNDGLYRPLLYMVVWHKEDMIRSMQI